MQKALTQAFATATVVFYFIYLFIYLFIFREYLNELNGCHCEVVVNQFIFTPNGGYYVFYLFLGDVSMN